MCQSQMNQIQYSDIPFYCLTATAPDKKKGHGNTRVSLETYCGRFEPRSHLSYPAIVRENVALNKTVVDTDGRSDNL